MWLHVAAVDPSLIHFSMCSDVCYTERQIDFRKLDERDKNVHGINCRHMQAQTRFPTSSDDNGYSS
jgi:hypothetical protein